MRRIHLMPLALIAVTGWFVACGQEETFEPTMPDRMGPSADAAQDDLIPGQYIVVFKDNVNNPVQLAGQLAQQHGATLRHTYEHAIKGFSAKLPDGAVAALQLNPNVKFIEQNKYWYIDTHPNLNRSALLASTAAVKGKPGGDNKGPTNLVATAAGTSSIDLTWTDGKGESGYEIERRLGQVGAFEVIAEVGSDVTSYTDTGLLSDTEYCYQVRGFKQKGSKPREYTAYTNIDCATTEAGTPTPPDAPSGLTADPVAYNQVDLSWTDNSDNEDSFEIERCTGTSAACGDTEPFGFLASVGANVTSYSDNTTSAVTTYTYRVFARNTDGDSPPSNEAEATTPEEPAPSAPAAPSDLNANPVAYNQVDLSWTDNSDNEDSFEIERCTGTSAACGDANFGFLASVGANVTTYTDNTVLAEMTYTYRVLARNTVGDSPYSNEAEATTPAEPAPGDCPDNGTHDEQNDPGDYGITAIQATYNDTWAGVRGNDPATCGIKAWFFGLDSGVDSDHPDLNVVETVDFVGDGSGGEDGNGHGTHTAGTAAAIDGGPEGGVVGVAPGADIHGFKVCSDSGSCPLDAIIDGVDEVTLRKNNNSSQPMVANMSLGGGASTSIDNAVRNSINAGVVYSLSAGNGVFGACLFPADAQNASPARVGDDDINASGGSNGDSKRVNGALTTTSHNSSFSDVNCNFGNPVTIAAPGSGIRSTWLNAGYNTISGTSMAAPHSAGAAMLYLQDGTDDPTTVEGALCQRTLPWTTNDLPNAEGRLNVDGLGTDPADAPNQPTGSSTCS